MASTNYPAVDFLNTKSLGEETNSFILAFGIMEGVRYNNNGYTMLTIRGLYNHYGMSQNWTEDFCKRVLMFYVEFISLKKPA